MSVSKLNSTSQSVESGQKNIEKDQKNKSSPGKHNGRVVSVLSEVKPQVNSSERGRDVEVTGTGIKKWRTVNKLNELAETVTDELGATLVGKTVNGEAGETRGGIASDEEAMAIKNGLEGIYNDLFHVGTYRTDDLVKAKAAFQSSKLSMFYQALDQVGLAEVGQSFVDSALQIFTWCETSAAPVFPTDLKNKIKKYKALQEKQGKASEKLYAVDNPEKQVKKVQSLLKKADALSGEVLAFKEEQLDPARDQFECQVKSSIKEQIAWDTLYDSYQAIRGSLPDDVQLEAAVIQSIMTWSYNVLVNRSKEGAAIKD